MWSSCPHLDVSNREACQMTIHGAPISSLSLYSIPPPYFEREPVTPLHNHTHMHTSWHTHTERMGQTTDKKVHMSTFHRVTQLSPAACCSYFLSTFQKSACFLLSSPPSPLTKTCFIHYLHVTTEREQWRQVEKTPWPHLPHLSSPWDFPHLRTDLCFVVIRCSLEPVWSQGDKKG